VRIDFVNEVAKILSIKRRDLIEKDVILHQIISDLSKDDFFAGNFLFKGGTCLVKCYFGYLRFSEDIDFTGKTRAFSTRSRRRKSEHTRDTERKGQGIAHTGRNES